MKFTYESYSSMLIRLREKGYSFRDYKTWKETERTVILRHDVDNSLEKAVLLSEVEKNICGGGATYFVLLSTDFYNLQSKKSREYINSIIKNGGSIGLHFDETQYMIRDDLEMKAYIRKEIELLSNIIDASVDVVSMHRPSEKVLAANIEFPDLINSYSEIYFKQMKYLSDSRRFWRENVDEIIESAAYPRLHILTHPFWYMEGREKNLKQTLEDAILCASLDYYDRLNDNFRDLSNEIERKKIERIIYR